jgi:hypothetical protein
MKAFSSVGVLLIFASLAHAHVIEKGAEIEQVASEMKAANYRPTGRDSTLVFPQQDPQDWKLWSVDGGALIVTYSTVTKKISGITYVVNDERPKGSRKEFYFAVTRFDIKTGEMVIQTELPKPKTSN